MSEDTQTKTPPRENKMGTMPVPRLLLNMSLPIMLSTFVLACYNIVDTIFVARMGEDALTAMGLAFPVQTLMNAVAMGTAVGANALLAMKLGEKRFSLVNKIAMNAFFLAVCSFVVFFLLSFVFITPYLKTQAKSDQIITFGEQYLRVIMAGCLAMFVATTSDRLLQATGRTFYTMITQMAGAITNIILDPLMIFGIGPFPRMGMSGAALATILGQTVSAVVSIAFNLTRNSDVHFSFKDFRPESSIIIPIYKIGIPSILLQSINSVTTYAMNLILGRFTSTAIAVYSTYFKLHSFIFMPVFGLNTGMVPIVSYNYGARKPRRIEEAVKTTLSIAAGVMVVGLVIFELFPDKLLGIFSAGENMMAIGCRAMRSMAPSFLGAAVAITFGSTFQALGKSVLSMMVSFVRQIIVLLPVAYLLSLTGRLENVWWCFVIAEGVAVVLSAFFMKRIRRKIISKL